MPSQKQETWEEQWIEKAATRILAEHRKHRLLTHNGWSKVAAHKLKMMVRDIVRAERKAAAEEAIKACVPPKTKCTCKESHVFDMHEAWNECRSEVIAKGQKHLETLI